MNNIDHAQISGFKGIRSVDLDFGDVNIITGRNNTGKSSILEAIELTSQPRVISRYGSNMADLINISSEKSKVQLEMGEGTQTLQLSQPPLEEVPETLVDCIDQVEERDGQRQHGWRYSSTNQGPDAAIFKDSIKKHIRSLSLDSFTSTQNNLMDITINGETYRYVHIEGWPPFIDSEQLDEISASIEQDHAQELEKIREEYGLDLRDSLERYLYYSFQMPGRRGIYLKEPPSFDGVEYIREPMIEGTPSTEDEEDAAVKKVRVRDYLRERGILNDLEDFDFDDLVFDEGGNQYSIPYDFMGDGFQTIVGIVWQFVGDKEFNDVLLLEEPENHMHPGYVSRLVPFLLQVARTEDIQLFITTHNVDFIMEFFSDNINQTDQEYLEEGLRLIQMSSVVPKQFDYAEARSQMKDIHNDLRGI